MDDQRGNNVWDRIPTYLKLIAGALLAAIALLGVYTLEFNDGKSAIPPSAAADSKRTPTTASLPATTTTLVPGPITLDPKTAAISPPAPPRTLGSGPQTSEHYTPNDNFSGSTYLPGADGFNLADVSDNSATAALPAGVKGLEYVGSCAGATPSFQTTIASFIGDAKVFGFYLVDEPHLSLCPPANLKAESDWIHNNDPGTKTFIVVESATTNPATPNYSNTYNPANTDVDLFGLVSYPCQKGVIGCAYSWIPSTVAAAERAGIPLADIVPVYQAFGAYDAGQWVLPTAKQESEILSMWGSSVPSPVFDYAYSWGVQWGDQALGGSPSLQSIFLVHNG
jgi:hypothetical protein